ncbi:MAG: rhamnulokinase [Verrucomicrobia bacterium]|nr:MAG: rhamnulokinase [Verrucomicrobiota bacterium]
MTTRYLACDLGAESGRLMLGTLESGRLRLEEVHRFPTGATEAAGSLHWDIERFFGEVREGLRRAAAAGPIRAVSTDSWGVDYLLYDEADRIIPPVYHYRDPRCERGVQQVYSRVSWEEIFAETGIQFMPINTLFQLGAETPERLQRARRILGIGDGFNAWLSGVHKWETSLASTTQLYEPRSRQWSAKLLAAVGVRPEQMGEVVASGTVLGPMREELAAETGLQGVQVVAGLSHDTGAAVAAVPAQGQRWAYLSSGTWSLMGVELPEPVINDTCRELNFTNELGYGGTVRLLKNIIGLWLVQECRRAWAAAGQEMDYATLTQLATEAAPFRALINPADARFLPPGGMPERIQAFCRETGQPVPETPGAIVRCVLESLALLYAETMDQLSRLIGWRPECLHIVGGGSRNRLLNQLTADALQMPVVTGPVEATAAGNVLAQAMALGEVGSHAEAREVVRRSFELARVEPGPAGPWAEARDRFRRLVGG